MGNPIEPLLGNRGLKNVLITLDDQKVTLSLTCAQEHRCHLIFDAM